MHSRFFCFLEIESSSCLGHRRSRVRGLGHRALGHRGLPGPRLLGRHRSPCRTRCPCCCCISGLRGVDRTTTAVGRPASASVAALLKVGLAGGGAGAGTTLSSLGLLVAGSPVSPSTDRSSSAASSLAATLYAGEVRCTPSPAHTDVPSGVVSS
jgi:hypothetical protein